ncbi:MAG: helix-turn-helix domain-containing protein, partial [Candidatus Magnetoovum sp. WYHC-5]|nr:helix-turn-helix domain-containing protein [Candidatus Magnetoovum sp. WYHC-5]
MGWEGIKIKEKAKELNISLNLLSEQVGVSRQTMDNWIKGEMPMGKGVIALCDILQVSPDYFFRDDTAQSIYLPVHRMRRTAKINDSTKSKSYDIVKEYAVFFKNTNKPDIPKLSDIEGKNSLLMADTLRAFAGSQNAKPISYDETVRLMERLSLNVVFRYFPDEIKSYAFYTRIFGHKIVFVNNTTNIIDLIFALLHEAIHSILDKGRKKSTYDDKEERFCDDVANLIQLPQHYVESIYSEIKGKQIGTQVNILKKYAGDNKHSLHGILKRIKAIDRNIDINIGGADANLKKDFQTIGDILFSSDEPMDYIDKLHQMSPIFYKNIVSNIENMSCGKLGELLGLY